MNLEAIQQLLRKLDVGKNLCHLRTGVSSLVVGGPWWDEVGVAREIMQNFCDADRDEIEDVQVTANGSAVVISNPVAYNLKRLFCLGTEEGEDDIGHYGKRFKAAAMCLLRDYHVTPIAISVSHVVCLHIAEEPVPDTDLHPLMYTLFSSELAYAGSELILDGCSPEMARALQTGTNHFFYDGNPLIGEKLWSTPDESVSLYRSNTSDGHLFYRNLKRGEMRGLPLVLVINREFKSVRNRIEKDCNCSALCEQLMELF